MKNREFCINWRIKAFEFIDEGRITPELMAECCLKYMSSDDIKEMLELNELISSDDYNEA